MSRWDETNVDNYEYEKTTDHEEVRLLKKFDDYRDLEKRELEKRNHQNITQKEKGGAWSNQFLFLIIIQAVSIVGFMAALIFFEFVFVVLFFVFSFCVLNLAIFSLRMESNA